MALICLFMAIAVAASEFNLWFRAVLVKQSLISSFRAAFSVRIFPALDSRTLFTGGALALELLFCSTCTKLHISVQLWGKKKMQHNYFFYR